MKCEVATGVAVAIFDGCPQSSSTVGVMVTPLLICPHPIRLTMTKGDNKHSYCNNKKDVNTPKS